MLPLVVGMLASSSSSSLSLLLLLLASFFLLVVQELSSPQSTSQGITHFTLSHYHTSMSTTYYDDPALDRVKERFQKKHNRLTKDIVIRTPLPLRRAMLVRAAYNKLQDMLPIVTLEAVMVLHPTLKLNQIDSIRQSSNVSVREFCLDFMSMQQGLQMEITKELFTKYYEVVSFYMTVDSAFEKMVQSIFVLSPMDVIIMASKRLEEVSMSAASSRLERRGSFGSVASMGSFASLRESTDGPEINDRHPPVPSYSAPTPPRTNRVSSTNSLRSKSFNEHTPTATHAPLSSSATYRQPSPVGGVSASDSYIMGGIATRRPGTGTATATAPTAVEAAGEGKKKGGNKRRNSLSSVELKERRTEQFRASMATESASVAIWRSEHAQAVIDSVNSAVDENHRNDNRSHNSSHNSNHSSHNSNHHSHNNHSSHNSNHHSHNNHSSSGSIGSNKPDLPLRRTSLSSPDTPAPAPTPTPAPTPALPPSDGIAAKMDPSSPSCSTRLGCEGSAATTVVVKTATASAPAPAKSSTTASSSSSPLRDRHGHIKVVQVVQRAPTDSTNAPTTVTATTSTATTTTSSVTLQQLTTNNRTVAAAPQLPPRSPRGSHTASTARPPAPVAAHALSQSPGPSPIPSPTPSSTPSSASSPTSAAATVTATTTGTTTPSTPPTTTPMDDREARRLRDENKMLRKKVDLLMDKVKAMGTAEALVRARVVHPHLRSSSFSSPTSPSSALTEGRGSGTRGGRDRDQQSQWEGQDEPPSGTDEMKRLFVGVIASLRETIVALEGQVAAQGATIRGQEELIKALSC